MKHRLFLLAAPALFLVLGLAPSPARAGEPEVVRFGVCLSLTGEFEHYGLTTFAGVKMRLNAFNARADETGVKLEMLTRDDQSNPAKAAAIVDELADQGVPVIIGPDTTDVIMAMIPRAKARGVVLITPGATSSKIEASDDWAFKVLFSDDRQGVALAQFVARDLKATRAAAIVNTHFEYGSSIFEPFAATFAKEGGRIVEDEHYQWDLNIDSVPDFTGILARIKETKPDVVLVPGYAEEAAEIIRQSQAVGLKTRFLGGDGWYSSEMILGAGNNLEGSYFVGSRDPNADMPEVKRFMDLLDQSTDPNADIISMHGYDSMALIIEAIKSGARSANEIQEWLYSLKNYPLATGDITFDREKGDSTTIYIYRADRVGDTFVPVVVSEYRP